MTNMIRLTRRYELECAHHLTAGVPEDHRCRRVHGHRYIVWFTLEGPIADDGMLVEYQGMDATLYPILKNLDHHDLNTLHERDSSPEAAILSSNPTVERLATYLLWRCRLVETARNVDRCMKLISVRVEEDRRSSVEAFA